MGDLWQTLWQPILCASLALSLVVAVTAPMELRRCQLGKRGKAVKSKAVIVVPNTPTPKKINKSKSRSDAPTATKAMNNEKQVKRKPPAVKLEKTMRKPEPHSPSAADMPIGGSRARDDGSRHREKSSEKNRERSTQKKKTRAAQSSGSEYGQSDADTSLPRVRSRIQLQEYYDSEDQKLPALNVRQRQTPATSYNNSSTLNSTATRRSGGSSTSPKHSKGKEKDRKRLMNYYAETEDISAHGGGSASGSAASSTTASPHRNRQSSKKSNSPKHGHSSSYSAQQQGGDRRSKGKAREKRQRSRSREVLGGYFSDEEKHKALSDVEVQDIDW